MKNSKSAAFNEKGDTDGVDYFNAEKQKSAFSKKY